MVREKRHWKTSRREVSSTERETGRKGSKSGAPAEIGRYHMYGYFWDGPKLFYEKSRDRLNLF